MIRPRVRRVPLSVITATKSLIISISVSAIQQLVQKYILSSVQILAV